MAKIDRKKQIMTESLILFSERGYDGVSMRDIARQVGVRESALYKHFENKLALENYIIGMMKVYCSEVVNEIRASVGSDVCEIAEKYINEGVNVLKKQCVEFFLFWYKDEQAVQFRRLLIQERFRHPKAGRILRDFLEVGVLEYLSALFNEMIKLGYFKELDSELLAWQFYAPLYLLLDKYENKVEMEEIAVKQLERLIESFDATYRKES